MEPGFDCVFVRSSFPRRAAPSVHVRLHVVQHVSQRVLDHSSPAHIAHLSVRGKKQTTEDQTTADVSERFVRMWISKGALTGWYFRSFGGCLKCGPKLTDTWKETGWSLTNWRKNEQEAGKSPTQPVCNWPCSSCRVRWRGSRGLQTGFHKQHLGSLRF